MKNFEYNVNNHLFDKINNLNNNDNKKLIDEILNDNNLKILNKKRYNFKNIYNLLSFSIFYSETYNNYVLEKILLWKKNLLKNQKDYSFKNNKLKFPKNKSDINIIFELFSLCFNKNINIMKVNESKCILNICFYGNKYQKNIMFLEKNDDFIYLTSKEDFETYNYFNNIFNKYLINIEINYDTYLKMENIKNKFNKKKGKNKLIEALKSKIESPLKMNLNKNIPLNWLDNKILSETNYYLKHKKHNLFSGWLKFYDEKKKYGFIINDWDKKDIFVHYDDLIKIKGNEETIINLIRNKYLLKFQFECYYYKGKYNESTKAINLDLIEVKNNN